ncbi:DUF397 domain-containing protein [Actinomadura rugatobispora]|uniref:DUF397 domain-containing protein n=1 Tax=Actinomadura rugatobispora TaxID=1994 RepID=A0ABW1AJ55_9ACTN|nr:hypothetical protein GCM10010200_057510 [Actinomadura rugatobispora]
MDRRVKWRKASRSGANGGNCVEVADLDRVIGVRDSKDPGGPRLALSQGGWSALVAEVRSGRHDL